MQAYFVAAVALVVTLVLLVLGTPPPTQDGDPSSRVAGRAGTLALYDWLGALGFTVHRISGTFDTTAENVLIIADPRTTITDADAGAVMGALSHGTDVVLALSPASAAPASALLRRLRVTLDSPRVAGDSTPAQPFDAGERVHHVPMAAGTAIDPAPYLTLLLNQSGAVTAVAEQVAGAGRAYVLASAFPVSNDGLRREDSATLVLSLLERARGGAIGFDEYHHGEVDARLDGAAAILESPLGLALLLAAAASLAFLALSGRRLGRPLPLLDPSLVPTTAAYIDAMAGLYSRSRDRGVVASRYVEELKERLATGDARSGQAGDEALVSAVRSARPELVDAVIAVLAQARGLAAGAPDAAALLELARHVDDIERRWALTPASAPAQWRQ